MTLLTSSWGRICFLAFLLVGWTAGVSFAISYLSPIDDLVRTAPIESDEKTIAELDRLTVQSELASDLVQKSGDLLDQYRSAADQILGELVTTPDWLPEAAARWWEGLTAADLVEITYDSRRNPRLTDGNLSQQILRFQHIIDYDYEDETGANRQRVETVQVLVWQPVMELVLTESEEGAGGYNPGRTISISSVSGPDQRKKISIKSKNDSSSVAQFDLSEKNPVFNDRSSEWLQSFLVEQSGFRRGEDNTLLTGGVLVLIDESFYDDAVIFRLAEDITLAIRNHVSRLEKITSNYRDASISIERRRSELESRLRSSPELFAVSVFRASLITIVVVSVGFVLLRAFAAELTQARRLASSNLAREVTEEFPPEKLDSLPDLIRAISGDGQAKAVAADGTPPDAVTTAEKLGDAVSKFASAVKKTG